ncbi:hypothetical protein AVEN_115389-1 [Araneus ventricosus]|uniref:Uncharacterized protein n=1 Tax=Araneus ventricosus TaxID=182803 RepID=A0A4Y2A090_ARAVE|nr:hypothetical protein AVEN_115389-1 [Araneus ventricosus]
MGSRTDFHVQRGIRTVEIYLDIILQQHVRLFIGTTGADFSLWVTMSVVSKQGLWTGALKLNARRHKTSTPIHFRMQGWYPNQLRAKDFPKEEYKHDIHQCVQPSHQGIEMKELTETHVTCHFFIAHADPAYPKGVKHVTSRREENLKYKY